mmetsp:Transcript_10871/g.20046  ORF Transcript_10871/g.20046 Transcript_10871/m.20046 type:complete len:223 (+) Transcript_10871:329-997(+)
MRRQEYLNEKIGTALWFMGKASLARKRLAEEADDQRCITEETINNASLRRSIRLTRGIQKIAKKNLRWIQRRKDIEAAKDQTRFAQAMKAERAESRREAALLQKVEIARCTTNRVTVARLENRAQEVVDAAIRTALTNTHSKNAEARRQEMLEDIQNNAESQVSHAKGIARYQKELQLTKAEVTLHSSNLRMLQTSKRRNNLMSQRKAGQSTISQLQPYAGL